MENKTRESNELVVTYILHKNYSKQLQIWLMKTKLKNDKVTTKGKSFKILNSLIFITIY